MNKNPFKNLRKRNASGNGPHLIAPKTRTIEGIVERWCPACTQWLLQAESFTHLYKELPGIKIRYQAICKECHKNLRKDKK